MTKKRTKTALALTVSTLAIAVLAFAFVMHHARSSGSLPQTVDSLTVGYNYPVASTLQQMIDSADYIVMRCFISAAKRSFKLSIAASFSPVNTILINSENGGNSPARRDAIS